jgi:hypothetical protein
MIYIKKLVCDLYQEKDDLISRLNDIQQTIEDTDPLLERVRLKIQWMIEKKTSLNRIQKHILTIERLISEEYLPGRCPLNWKLYGYHEMALDERPAFSGEHADA